MLWKLKLKEETLELEPNQVLDTLMSKHMTVNRPDFEVLTQEFARFMQWKTALHEASIQQLLLIAFSLGYFYRVFKEKNDVEVISESNDNESDEQSGS